MRTLTKERIDLSGSLNNSNVFNQDLVVDGPKEAIYKKVHNLQTANKQSLALANQERILKAEQDTRKKYAKRFISRCTKMFGISRENMKDLVLELKDKDIVLLENIVLEKLRKPAFLQVVGSFGAITIFMGSSLASFLFGNQAVIVLTAMLFFTGLGWLIPFMFLTEFVYGSSNNGECGANTATGYIGSQRVFKKKYGAQYFPYQEVKKELGLIENDTKESYY